MSLAEVHPNIYVSDFNSAVKHGHHFDYIFNCTHDLINVTPHTFRIPYYNSDNHTVVHSWTHYIPQFDNFISDTKTILLYSAHGISRSASTAVAYLIYKHPYLSIIDLIEEIKYYKPDVEIHYKCFNDFLNFKRFSKLMKKNN